MKYDVIFVNRKSVPGESRLKKEEFYNFLDNLMLWVIIIISQSRSQTFRRISENIFRLIKER